MIVPDRKIFAQFEFLSTPEWMNDWVTDWLTGVFITTRPVFIVLFRKGSKSWAKMCNYINQP